MSSRVHSEGTDVILLKQLENGDTCYLSQRGNILNRINLSNNFLQGTYFFDVLRFYKLRLLLLMVFSMAQEIY